MQTDLNLITEVTDEATNFQACAHLKIDDVYSQLRLEGKCGLEAVFALQKDIQTNVYNHDFDTYRKSNSELLKFFNTQYHAIQDEFRELFAALGGMSKYGIAFWKDWKAKHKDCMADSWDNLSRDDQFEAFYEFIDILHFFMNIAITIGLTPDLMVNMYFAKNLENRKRQLKPGGY